MFFIIFSHLLHFDQALKQVLVEFLVHFTDQKIEAYFEGIGHLGRHINRRGYFPAFIASDNILEVPIFLPRSPWESFLALRRLRMCAPKVILKCR